ncbi:MAG: hypothetical protein LBF86_07330 [Helicobacteraceae bacterium]|jgi:hypothetical protein|nr:hypothetical protein [Helicobacteraceae bacterium]
MHTHGFKLLIDRPLFRKRFTEALIASARLKTPITLFYDLNDGGFDYANTQYVNRDLLPIAEIDANKTSHNLPLDNPKELENILKSSEEKIIAQMLPELIERLTPIMAARRGS